jgi:guanylate kinase
VACGNLLVVSAPSGAGKTTILRQILAKVPKLAFSVSHTTRPPRPGERHAIDYFFVKQEEFLEMRDRGAFLEWAEVHSNFYGTSKAAVAEQLARGIDIVLDIDVQGARQVREQSEWRTVSIFIAPPSMAELERRLTMRNTEDLESVRLRLANAARELAEMARYDYVVVNDRFEEAVDGVRAVIIAERSRQRRSIAGLPLELPGSFNL